MHGSKKAFLWVYERNGYINLNVKVRPEWRDFWRDAYALSLIHISGTWDLLEKVRKLADKYNLTLLPEIHASYGEKNYERCV